MQQAAAEARGLAAEHRVMDSLQVLAPANGVAAAPQAAGVVVVEQVPLRMVKTLIMAETTVLEMVEQVQQRLSTPLQSHLPSRFQLSLLAVEVVVLTWVAASLERQHSGAVRVHLGQ